jgi:hypothetical protein
MDFGAKVKSEGYPKQEIFKLIDDIQPKSNDADHIQLAKEIRVYLAMTYFIASRSGELLPYIHYKSKYQKDPKTKKTLFVNGKKGPYPILARTKTGKKMRRPISKTLGPFVKDIKYRYDENDEAKMIVVSVPVFKNKDIPYETGYIPRKGNPFFGEILCYINETK